MPPAAALFVQINRFAQETTWLHGPASAFARDGIVVFAALIVLGWWLARRGDGRAMAAALLTPAAAVVALGVQQVLVSRVHEARPYAVFPDALVLVAKTSDPSFPSDHACVAGAVAVGLFVVDRRLGAITAALALVMAADRVYVGAHWPLDVVVGLAVGAGLTTVIVLLAGAPTARLVGWVGTTRLRPLVSTTA